MSIKYSDKFLSFLSKNSNNKCCKLLYFSQNTHTTELNFISERDSMISFLPAGKELIYSENGNWSKKNRQTIKPGKFVKMALTEDAYQCVSIKDLEDFSNVFKSYFSKYFEFKILPNTSIAGIYNDIDEIGSCMEGSKADDDYFAIYENCEALQIVVLFKDSKPVGRALLWETSDGMFLDRFYTQADSDKLLFIEFAKQNNYFYKKNYNSFGDKMEFFCPPLYEEAIVKTLRIETDTDYDQFPYIDTFTYGSDGYLTNVDVEHYSYTNTNGIRGDKTKLVRCACGCEMEEDGDDAHYLASSYEGFDYACSDCVCVIDDGYYNVNDNDIVLTERDSYQFRTSCVEIDRDWYLKSNDDIVYTCNDSYQLIGNCVEINYEWYLEDDITVVLTENDYYQLKDNCVEIDGGWYLESDDSIAYCDEINEWKLKQY